MEKNTFAENLGNSPSLSVKSSVKWNNLIKYKYEHQCDEN